MKTISPISVIKSKLLYAIILHARLGTKIKQRTQRIVRYELNLARPEI